MLEVVNQTIVGTSDVANKNLFALADSLIALRELKDQIETSLDLAKERIARVETAMVEIMTNEEIPNFQRNDKAFNLTTKTYASVRAESKESFIAWLDDHGFGDLAPRGISSQTLSSWVKEQTQDQDLPGELRPMLSVFDKTSVSVRKGKVSK